MGLMITVSNLTFDYPGRRALSDLSFDLPPQSITALVGPNGAGKTTLLRCLAALDMPIQGKILVNELDILNFPRAAHQLIGYLPDTFGVYEDLSVHQCLMYHAMVYGIPVHDRKDRISAVAQTMHIETQLHETVSSLSRGKKQRLGIAQIMIQAPKIILLDEPASNLDPEARHHLCEVFKMLNANGATLVISSHILSELQDYCTHMLILNEGKIRKFCEVSSIKDNMMNVYLENI